MNLGNILRTALQRAEMPFDSDHLDLARGYVNDNIQHLWYAVKADFRQSRDSIVTIANADEYVLNKLFDGFVPDSFRGSSTNPRVMIYKPPQDFFRETRNYSQSTGTPSIFTYGDMSGVDQQLPSASRIEVYSTLANKGNGTVSVTNGSDFVNGIGTIFSLNDVGLYFKKSGDTTTYKIVEWISSTRVRLEDKYRGITGSGFDYGVGDIGVHVSVQGYVNGEINSEDIVLDGSAVQTTTKTFNLVTSVTKTSLTGGNVVARNTANTVNVAIIAPGDYETERQTIVLWRIPDAAETLPYRFYMKHPYLRLDSDRCYIPNKYHRLITMMTEADLRGWAGMTVADVLVSKISEEKVMYYNDVNNTALWAAIPQDEGIFGGWDINNRAVDQDFVGI